MSEKDEQNKEGGFYVVEPVEISSESEPEDLQDISELDDMKADDSDIQDIYKLIAATKKEELQIQKPAESQKPSVKTEKKLEVVDDFIRNFLIKHKMNRSLEIFQQEWYEMQQKGQELKDLEQVPDLYVKNEKMQEEIDYLNQQLDKYKEIAEKAKATYDKLRKERDFHKMHHHRVQQEKKKQNHDIEKLKALHQQYEVKYEELSQKYSHAMKEKMLLKLEKDRLVAKNEALQKSLQNIEEKIGKDGQGLTGDQLPKLNEAAQEKDVAKSQQGEQKDLKKSTKKKLTPFPSDDRPNPYAGLSFETHPYKNAILSKTFKGHMMSISSIAMHPKKSICATASDDFTWKIWTLPQGELIMSGEGHKDWVSGVGFHPKGSHLVTCSGDCTIKVWDFINAACTHTFKDHIQPVWSVAFHDTGDFVASCSMDHTAKLFDLNAGKVRHTFRGHVDSVNHITFQPYSNILATASADKTLSLWDMKSGLCIQTFYGHLNSVNSVAFSLKGDMLVSCDSDGIVKVWDVRMVKGKSQFDAGPYSANTVSIDKSGVIIAVASDEGLIKLFNEQSQKLEHTLKGHEDSVQDVQFDYNSKMIISCGSDNSFRVWQ